jgi:hypothetical protein
MVYDCPQVPRQITTTESTLVAVMPLEFAWWFVFRVGWAPAGWIMVLSNRAELVAGLAVRAAAGVNIVWGIVRPDTGMDDVGAHQVELMRLIKICDGLPPVKWDQGSTIRRRWFRVGWMSVTSALSTMAHLRKGSSQLSGSSHEQNA